MAFNILRLYKLLTVIIIFVSLLIVRLTYIQIVIGEKLAAESLAIRVQEYPLETARGDILDRNGLLLTNTAQHYSLVLFPGQIPDSYALSRTLSKLINIPANEIINELAKYNHPFKLNCSLDTYTAQKINKMHLPGALAVTEKVRYGYNPLAAHIKGYINAADNKGVSGIEKMFDGVLKDSQSKFAAALVDAGQKIIPGLGYKCINLNGGVEGGNVVLTIDKYMQKTVEDAMDRHHIKGAVIIIRPSTGEILAMASRPNFDANNLPVYLHENSAPLLNRAISPYQPGSVFKLAVAAAALEYGVVKPSDTFFDPGYIEVHNHRFKGWDFDQGGRGWLTFTDALAYSSNPVLIQVGLKLGADRLISFAKTLGFGRKTNLNFEGEAAGNLPSPHGLYPAELANLSIGQGVFEATPLQIVTMVATIVNDGIKVDPYIVDKIINSQGVVIKQYSPARGNRVLSKQTALQMREMMQAVTKYGTGKAAFVPDYGSAGKTGSAETGRINAQGQGISHAWFAGYAPLVNPQYAAVVFVEDGMSGGEIAAPIFSEIFSEILKQ